MLTLAMSTWLVTIQSVRADNAEVIVTPFPNEYYEFGSDVEAPCAVAISTVQTPGTVQCVHTNNYWSHGEGNFYYFFLIFPEFNFIF